MKSYEARPKNGLTGRHKAELAKAGFAWTGQGWIAHAEKPPKVWGCTVRLVKPVQPIVIQTEQDMDKWLKKSFGL